MHRIDADGHVGNLFDEGDPGVPRQPTQVDVDWLNAVQEELCNFATGSGLTLVKGTNTQLKSALANPGSPTYATNFDNGGLDSLGCVKGPDGWVRLRGYIENSTGGNITGSTTVATLPTGYRPATTRELPIIHVTGVGWETARLRINTDGTLNVFTKGTWADGEEVDVTGVSFPTT